jgi:hypothetical protein
MPDQTHVFAADGNYCLSFMSDKWIMKILKLQSTYVDTYEELTYN